MERTKKEDDEKGAEVKEVKKALDRHLQEAAAHQKLLTQREADLEKLVAERHECLYRCKIEELDLPLASGSLADVTETDAPVTINYKGLASEYKKVRRGPGKQGDRGRGPREGTAVQWADLGFDTV